MDAPGRAPRAARVHVPLPGFYDAMLARFAPTRRERLVVGLLLRVLRIPGVTRLIRAWHAWRTR